MVSSALTSSSFIPSGVKTPNERHVSSAKGISKSTISFNIPFSIDEKKIFNASCAISSKQKCTTKKLKDMQPFKRIKGQQSTFKCLVKASHVGYQRSKEKGLQKHSNGFEKNPEADISFKYRSKDYSHWRYVDEANDSAAIMDHANGLEDKPSHISNSFEAESYQNDEKTSHDYAGQLVPRPNLIMPKFTYADVLNGCLGG